VNRGDFIMTNLNLNNFILKLACALLLQNKELSMDEIKALPLVDDESAEVIKQALLKIFNADIYQKKRSDLIVPYWEEIVVLKE